MGWWSADILGGDSPLDELSALEREAGWKSEAPETSLYDVLGGRAREEPKERLLQHFRSPEVVANLKTFILTKRRQDYDAAELLTDLHVFIELGMSLDEELETYMVEAFEFDLKEWDNDPQRKEAQRDLRERLAVFRKTVKPVRKWDVYLTRHRTCSLSVKGVEAATLREAKAIAKRRAETMTPNMHQDRFEIDEVLEAE